MRDAYPAIIGLGGEVVAISTEPLATARGAVAEAGIPFPVLSDPGLEVVDRFGLRHVDEPEGRRIARPALILLDRSGVVRYAHVGDHPRDRPAIGAILLGLESLAEASIMLPGTAPRVIPGRAEPVSPPWGCGGESA